MADTANITLSSVLITQALNTLGTDPVWDRRLLDYLAYEALARADAEFGATRDAYEMEERTQAAIEAAFGKDYRADEKGWAVASVMLGQVVEAEDRRDHKYLYPLWQAARDLAETPAPNLAAALFKVHLAQVEDLGNDTKMPKPAMELVTADFDRLRAGEV